jgi:hypothetical protein
MERVLAKSKRKTHKTRVYTIPMPWGTDADLIRQTRVSDIGSPGHIEETRQLFGYIKNGRIDTYTSTYAAGELENAPSPSSANVLVSASVPPVLAVYLPFGLFAAFFRLRFWGVAAYVFYTYEPLSKLKF